MLVTILGCWWHLWECWCPTLMSKMSGFWRPKWPKPSPTSYSCHQHISSPTSVTNVYVTESAPSLIFLNSWIDQSLKITVPSNSGYDDATERSNLEAMKKQSFSTYTLAPSLAAMDEGKFFIRVQATLNPKWNLNSLGNHYILRFSVIHWINSNNRIFARKNKVMTHN